MNDHYNPKLKAFARELRTETVSKAEKRLWKQILSNNKQGVKFKRQRPILHYIVDFFSAEIGLIIEIDGNSHTNKGEYDRRRENQLLDLGYTLIRFSEGDVMQDLDSVGTSIQHVVYVLRYENVNPPP